MIASCTPSGWADLALKRPQLSRFRNKQTRERHYEGCGDWHCDLSLCVDCGGPAFAEYPDRLEKRRTYFKRYRQSKNAGYAPTRQNNVGYAPVNNEAAIMEASAVLGFFWPFDALGLEVVQEDGGHIVGKGSVFGLGELRKGLFNPRVNHKGNSHFAHTSNYMDFGKM